MLYILISTLHRAHRRCSITGNEWQRRHNISPWHPLTWSTMSCFLLWFPDQDHKLSSTPSSISSLTDLGVLSSLCFHLFSFMTSAFTLPQPLFRLQDFEFFLTFLVHLPSLPPRQGLTVYTSSWLWFQRLLVDSLKLVMVGLFTSQKKANATNQSTPHPHVLGRTRC